MSEHMFSVGRGEVTEYAARIIAAIARQHDYVFVNPELPGEGWRYWFAGPNLGAPFDRAAERAIWADLEAAGLANDDGLTEACFVEVQP